MADGPNGSNLSPVTVFVCQSCGEVDPQDPKLVAGERLLNALRERNSQPEMITVTGVDCLAVCERPVTVAFAAEGKWSYVLGDVDSETDAGDVLAAALAVAAAPHGVPAMEDRPPFFRDGVVSRVPPHGWEMPG